MKTKALVTILILFLAVLITSEGHATGKGSYKRAFRKDFVGTWVNSEYNQWTESRLFAKLVIKSDSMMMAYDTETSEIPTDITMRIDDRWTDTNGFTYYKVFVEWSGYLTSHELWRIDEAKETLELNWYRASYPDEINPKSGRYQIYYHQ